MSQNQAYLPLDKYKYAWVFRRQDMAVSESDLEKIKPLTAARAAEVWRGQISTVCLFPSHLGQGDWANDERTWVGRDRWQEAWDRADNALPELLADHIGWEPNVVVYFCYKHDHVVETTWGVFQRAWKSFLFFDDGPLLVGKKRKEVAQFFEDGTMAVGSRP